MSVNPSGGGAAAARLSRVLTAHCEVGSGGLCGRARDTPRVYTTCMHALTMHFLHATGLYGLARGSVAAAQRFAGSHALTW